MVKAQHLFEDGVYLISNHSVARHRLFPDTKTRNFFISRMEHHLSPICKIMGFCLKDDEFQILLKMKDRGAFISHFLSKKKNRDLPISGIPDCTYIFSQAMANFQVSFVKYFNYKFGRSGSLMAARFGRHLIESQNELEMWVERLNKGVKQHNYSGEWVDKTMSRIEAFTSMAFYSAAEGNKADAEGIYIPYYKINLGGYFENLPPKRLDDAKRFFTLRFNQLFGTHPGQFYQILNK